VNLLHSERSNSGRCFTKVTETCGRVTKFRL